SGWGSGGGPASEPASDGGSAPAPSGRGSGGGPASDPASAGGPAPAPSGRRAGGGPDRPPAPPAPGSWPPPRAPDEPETAARRANVVIEPGDGLLIQSDDGDFALRLGLRGALRATLDVPRGDDVAFDLAFRRARLNIGGYFFGEENRFRVQLAFSP